MIRYGVVHILRNQGGGGGLADDFITKNVPLFHEFSFNFVTILLCISQNSLTFKTARLKVNSPCKVLSS